MHSVMYTPLQYHTKYFQDFSGGSDVKESACNAGDLGLIPGLGRSLGGGNGCPLQILAWRTQWTEEPAELQRVHWVTKTQT